MKKFLVLFALALPACSLTDRQGLTTDAGRYTGAPEHPDGSLNGVIDGEPDFDPAEVGEKAAKDVLDKVAEGDYTGLALYVLGGAVALGTGFLARKKLLKKKS